MNNNTREEVESKSTGSRLILKHTGHFIAKFKVTWDERRYNEKGQAVDTPQQWSENGKYQTDPFSAEIELPANTVNLHVTAMAKTGLVWEPWKTVLDRILDLAPKINVCIWGNPLSQKENVTYEKS